FVTVLDVSDRAKPSVVSKTKIEGAISDSRLIDGRLYFVSQNFLNSPVPETVKNGDGKKLYESEASYRTRLTGSVIDDLLPTYSTNGGAEHALLDPPDVYVH